MAIADDTTTVAERPAWEGLLGRDEHGPYLVGARCASCRALSLGLRDLCPNCWRRNTLQPVSIGRMGRVYTCTTVHHAPGGIETPFAVGYVDIEEGIRVFAHLSEGVGIGAEVALTAARVRHAPDGAWLTGPRYVLR
jgi:uncharacterized OB-fold protein